MADFSHNDKFDPAKNYARVEWGADSQILEVELAELQKILAGRTDDLGKILLTDGFLTAPALAYSGGALTIPGGLTFVVGGIVVSVIDPMAIAAANGSTVYLETSEVEVLYTDTVKQSGNMSGGTNIADNGIFDTMANEETTRRIQRQVRLTLSNVDNTKKYLTVAAIAAGAATDTRVMATNPHAVAAKTDAKAYTDQQIQLVTATGIPKLVSYPYKLTATVAGQTHFDIPLTTFDSATDTLIVRQNRTVLDVGEFTVTNTVQGSPLVNGFVTLATGVAIGTAIGLLILKNVPIGPNGTINGAVLAAGSVPIDRIASGTNQTVSERAARLLETDTRKTEFVRDVNGVLTQIVEKDGVTVVSTTVFTYTTGKLSSVAETAGAKTVTSTLNRDGNGKLVDITKGVS